MIYNDTSHNIVHFDALKHLDNVISICCENVVKVFESLTASFWAMDTPLFSGHLGAFGTPSHLMLSLQ